MKINNLVMHVFVIKALITKTLVKSYRVKYTLLTLACVLLLGCAQQPDYVLAISHTQIKQVQILDLNAPERNDGIIATLNGNYGKNVVRKYQRSIYDMKASRQMKQSSQ